MRDSLHATHRAFVEALEKRVKAPGPERLARLVRELSTRGEGPEPSTREHLAARAHFFLTTDVAKLWQPGLEAVSACELLSRKEISVLDLHAGLGTATAGMALLLAAVGFRGRLKATLSETDSTLSGMARHAVDALCDSLPFRIETSFATAPDAGRHDLVLLFDPVSRGQLPADPQEIRKLAGSVLGSRVKKTGALVLVDQAARAVARSVATAATLLAADGRPVYAPCLCPAKGGPCECPYASRPGRFCFHSQPVPLTPLIQSAAARSGLDRTEVNYTYLLATASGSTLSSPEVAADQVAGRVISHPNRVKKGFTYFVCTGRDVVQGFAPRLLDDGVTRGGRLPHGTVVVLSTGRSE